MEKTVNNYKIIVIAKISTCFLEHIVGKSAKLILIIFSIGEGDTGDVWKIVCSGDAWARDEGVSFKHVDTGVFLGVSGRTFGRPIHGQMEVVGLSMPDSSTK